MIDFQEIKKLFDAKQYEIAIQKLNAAWNAISNKTKQLQKQCDIQWWLGRCYLEQAKKTDDKQKADEYFEQACSNFQQQLDLAEKLENGKEQMYAQSWLGHCYFEQAQKTDDKQKADEYFEKARLHFQKRFDLAKELKNKQEQINAQSWLGYCYFEQAQKTDDKQKADEYFEQARSHVQQQLDLAEKLENEQMYAEHWLGRCYFEQAKKTDNKQKADKYFKQARSHFQEQFDLSKKINDEQGQITAQFRLERCYFQLGENVEDEVKKNAFETYEQFFTRKMKRIQDDSGSLKDYIAQILAVLSIDPIEAHNRPFAHYTSPVVCEKLLGINQHPDKDKQPYENPSPMRMTSATYMNDPDEGKSLLDFLGKKELLLENKTPCREINAFFTCFSARVNDLNQFRLYGKVDGMEASGCCMVFNKKGEWVKQPDVSRSFEGSKPNADEPKMSETSNQDLPLYQVAYLAYKDDYYQKGEYDYDVDVNGKFAVRLKPIMIENPIWHKVRIEKLKEGLNKLRDELEKNPNLDTKDLEYIRYLFKDYAFRDEEEFRLLRMEEVDSKKLNYCPVTNSVYLEYGNVGNMVDEVILGTNYEKSSGKNKTEVFRHLLKRKHPRIAVSRSTLPIN